MIIYSTLENVSNEVLFETNMKTASERLKKEVNLDKFCEMLREKEYDPTISVGAFDTDTGECVSLVLNSILKDKENTAYDIITCTIPEYRRRGIARTIFEKVKVLLRERVKLSILVDTFCSKISCPMQLAPMNHSIFYV